MKHLIFDKSGGDAQMVCDEYGDAEVFGSYEAAEAYRKERCDQRRSYVFPRMGLFHGLKVKVQVWGGEKKALGFRP